MVSNDNAAPNAPFLPSADGVVEAGLPDRTGVAEFLSGEGGFTADFRIWEVFREEHLWQPLARYFPDCGDFEQQFAVWMSVVEHRVSV
jgi:hypothetical protein